MSQKTLVAVLWLSVLSVLFTACNQREFDGRRMVTPSSYNLDIEQMNGTDTHTMELNAGDILKIHFETGHGKLHMEIKAPDGTLIYTGNGEKTTDFTVNISASGEYFVRTKAHDAKGKIHIQLQTSGTDAVSTTEEQMK